MLCSFIWDNSAPKRSATQKEKNIELSAYGFSRTYFPWHIPLCPHHSLPTVLESISGKATRKFTPHKSSERDKAKTEEVSNDLCHDGPSPFRFAILQDERSPEMKLIKIFVGVN